MKLSRLEGGGRQPSTDVVERFIGVLGADETQADRLRASAGFKGKNNTYILRRARNARGKYAF